MCVCVSVSVSVQSCVTVRYAACSLLSIFFDLSNPLRSPAALFRSLILIFEYSAPQLGCSLSPHSHARRSCARCERCVHSVGTSRIRCVSYFFQFFLLPLLFGCWCRCRHSLSSASWSRWTHDLSVCHTLRPRYY